MQKPFAAVALTMAMLLYGAARADAPAAPDNEMPGPPPGFGPFPPPGMCESSDAAAAGMLAFAEVRLKITADEEPAWGRFKQAVQASLAPIRQACAVVPKARPAQPPKLPEQLAMVERMMAAHLDQLRQLRAAIADLYPTLTADQQRLADRVLDGPRHW